MNIILCETRMSLFVTLCKAQQSNSIYLAIEQRLFKLLQAG